MLNKMLSPLLFILLVSCGKEKPVTSLQPTDTVSTLLPKPGEKEVHQNTDPLIMIRQIVKHINTTSLNRKHFEFRCDEDMMVDYFYEDGEIVKISVDFGTIGDVYAKEDYYYDKGSLIFTYEFVEGGPACEGCIKTNEYRSYIVKDQTIRYLKDASEETCRKCSFNISSRQYKLLKAKNREEVKNILCPS